MIRLRLQVGSSVRDYAFHRTEVRIGRSPLNDLAIPAEDVSAKHGLLKFEEGGLFLEDLDSLSGTMIQRGNLSQMVQNKTMLKVGDRMMLGQEAVITLIDAQEAPTMENPLHRDPHHSPLSPEDLPASVMSRLALVALKQHQKPDMTHLLRTSGALFAAVSGLKVEEIGLLQCREEGAIFLTLHPETHEIVPGSLSMGTAAKAHLLEALKAGGVIHHLHKGKLRYYIACMSPDEPQHTVLVLSFNPRRGKLTIGESMSGIQTLARPIAQLLTGHVRQETSKAQHSATQAENHYFRERQRQHYLFKELVTESECMRTIYQRLHSMAREHEPVLIEGEPGTGKEMIARALHHLGSRSRHLMISQSCVNMDSHQLDTEIFGVGPQVEGTPERPSIFELAQGGTVFLDEVDRLPLLLQAKLLRVIKEGEVRRHGEESYRSVQVRVVLSTHRDLESLVRQGHFRRDLLMALQGSRITLPTLHERKEDILPLARTFAAVFARRYGVATPILSKEALSVLCGYAWPGNVRELRSAVELAVLQHQGGTLGPGDFTLNT